MIKVAVAIAAIVLLFGVEAGARKDSRIADACKFNKDIDTEVLDLADAIELALCNNPSTRATWLAAKAATASYNRAYAPYLPTLSAEATYQQGRTDQYTYVEDNTLMTNGTSIGASASWLLLDFGRRGANYDMARAAMMSREFQHNSNMQETAFVAIQNFYNLISADEALVAARANEDASGKAAQIAGRKFELGINSRADVLQAETAFYQTQLNTTRQEQAVLITRAQLAQSLGLPSSIALQIAMPEESEKHSIEAEQNLDELIATALANRSDLRARIEDVKSSKAGIDAVRSDFLPTLTAFGRSTWNFDHDHDANDRPFHHQRSMAAGLTLSVPLFKGFDTTFAYSAAKYNYRAAQENLKLTEQQVELSVVNAYHNFSTAQKSLVLAKKCWNPPRNPSASLWARIKPGAEISLTFWMHRPRLPAHETSLSPRNTGFTLRR